MDDLFELSEIKTRSCLSSDSDYIYNLKKITLKPYVEKIWGWDEDWNVNNFLKTFDPDKFSIIKYKDENIGCFSVVHKDYLIEIENIEIDPKFQRKGIGTYIINFLKQMAKNQKNEIILQVFKINHIAINFYWKQGFRKYEETKTHFKMKFIIKK